MTTETKRILITGSSGFIGRGLVTKLLKIKGLEIICIGNNSDIAPCDTRIVYKKIDLLSNPNKFFDVVARYRPSYFVHLAWDTRHGLYWTSKLNEDWSNFSKVALSMFIRYGGRRAVIAGSSAEVDLNNKIINEDTPPPPNISIYGQAKLNVLRSLPDVNASSRFTWVWPRFFNIYGPNEDLNKMVPRLFRSAYSNRPITLSNIDNFSDYIYIDDIASVVSQILFSKLVGVVNIGYGESVSVRSIGKLIENVTGKRVLFDEVEDAIGLKNYPIGYQVDISKIKSNLDWSPTYKMQDGLFEYSNNVNLEKVFKGK